MYHNPCNLLTRECNNQIPMKSLHSFCLQIGRKTLENCKGNNFLSGISIYPNYNAGHTDTIKFLTQEFGLTEREAVVLLGAHGLGK